VGRKYPARKLKSSLFPLLVCRFLFLRKNPAKGREKKDHHLLLEVKPNNSKLVIERDPR